MCLVTPRRAGWLDWSEQSYGRGEENERALRVPRYRVPVH